MSLAELIDNRRSDKNTVHSYLPLYEYLLSPHKEFYKNVLEIGICDGGSIKLWRDYFQNAVVYGVDIMDTQKITQDMIDNRIRLFLQTDAYSRELIQFLRRDNPNFKFDMVLDDGPHTLESMIMCVDLYFPLVADGGYLIIEDVQDIDWCRILKERVPAEYQESVKIYDLRSIKGRYDDIVFTVYKG